MNNDDTTWDINEAEGTAVGPTLPVHSGGTIVTLTALWSDTEGIGVTIDLPPDAVFFRQHMGSLRTAVDQLMSLEPPRLSVR